MSSLGKNDRKSEIEELDLSKQFDKLGKEISRGFNDLSMELERKLKELSDRESTGYGYLFKGGIFIVIGSAWYMASRGILRWSLFFPSILVIVGGLLILKGLLQRGG